MTTMASNLASEKSRPAPASGGFRLRLRDISMRVLLVCAAPPICGLDEEPTYQPTDVLLLVCIWK